MKNVLTALTAVSLLAVPVMAQAAPDEEQAPAPAEAQKSASIPFADSIGIRDWRADSDDAVYLQDVHGNWYRAELFMPAFDLPFVQFIGIDAGATGTLDKFGAIYVGGERYPFKSFVEVAGPTHRK